MTRFDAVITPDLNISILIEFSHPLTPYFLTLIDDLGIQIKFENGFIFKQFSEIESQITNSTVRGLIRSFKSLQYFDIWSEIPESSQIRSTVNKMVDRVEESYYKSVPVRLGPLMIDGLKMIDFSGVERILSASSSLTNKDNNFFQFMKAISFTNYLINLQPIALLSLVD